MTKDYITAAIHQPNFLPWLGFFDKIIRSDIFVILDHTANRPNDAIWTKRVQIICNKEPFWLTVPLKKPKGVEFQPINQMQIDPEVRYKDKHLKTIQLSYGKSPYYDEVRTLLDSFYDLESYSISDKNISFIKGVCDYLGLKRKFVKSSELNCEHSSTELLAEICQKIGANAYLYGKGSSDYQENEIFERIAIKPVAQDFSHPTYQQFNSKSFVAGLSIVDALMNCGLEGTKKLLNV